MEYKPILKENSKGKIRRPGTKKLWELVDEEDSDFVDFLEKCTEWKVSDRLTPTDALSHPWIQKGLADLAESKKRKDL